MDYIHKERFHFAELDLRLKILAAIKPKFSQRLSQCSF